MRISISNCQIMNIKRGVGNVGIPPSLFTLFTKSFCYASLYMSLLIAFYGPPISIQVYCLHVMSIASSHGRSKEEGI